VTVAIAIVDTVAGATSATSAANATDATRTSRAAPPSNAQDPQ
jgi:hypothetical protein